MVVVLGIPSSPSGNRARTPSWPSRHAPASAAHTPSVHLSYPLRSAAEGKAISTAFDISEVAARRLLPTHEAVAKQTLLRVWRRDPHATLREERWSQQESMDTAR